MSGHLLYIISHANVWHLVGNIFVLTILRGDIHIVSALVIAVLMSFLPTFSPIWQTEGLTMGFSGVLFAIAGIKYGVFCRHTARKGYIYRQFATKALPIALVGILFPNINWCIHTYCILAGFVYGRLRK